MNKSTSETSPSTFYGCDAEIGLFEGCYYVNIIGSSICLRSDTLSGLMEKLKSYIEGKIQSGASS